MKWANNEEFVTVGINNFKYWSFNGKLNKPL